MFPPKATFKDIVVRTPLKEVEAFQFDEAARDNIPIVESSEDALAVLDYGIFCSFHHSSRVGAGDTANAVVKGGVFRFIGKRKSGRIALKVVNHLGDEVMKVSRVV